MKTNINANTDAKLEAANQEIQKQVETALPDVLTYQTGRANTEIEKYLDEKLKTVSTSEGFDNASQEVVLYATQLIGEEKARIDQAIADYLG